MFQIVLANSIVFIHFIFILFVVFGSLLLVKWKKIAFFHLPALFWGVLIEFTGWVCPLTPLENHLRAKAGQSVFPGGFIDNYVIPVIYPDGLTYQIQILLGVILLITNVAIYGFVFSAKKRTDAINPVNSVFLK